MKHKYKYNLKGNNYLSLFNINSNRVTEISYYYLKDALESCESFILMIGGAWCKNTVAIMDVVSEYLTNNDLKMYLFDPRIGNKKKRSSDIRRCISLADENKMKLISKHMELDIAKNENETYKIKIPFIVKINKGIGKTYFMEEYLKKDVNMELKLEIIKKLEAL